MAGNVQHENWSADGDLEFVSLAVREERRKLTFVPSLKEKCLRILFQNVESYNKLPENPYKNIPDCLVQDLLALCRMPPEDEVDKCVTLVKLLLRNKNLTSLDIISLGELGIDKCDAFFHLALSNCTNLEHISAPCPLLLTASTEETVQLANKIVGQWKKLKSFDLMGFFVCDEAMTVIQEGLPKLEKISLAINKDKFTASGSRTLRKMPCITDVDIFMENYEDNMHFFVQLLMDIGGTMPKLQRLHLIRYADSGYLCTDFAHFFTKYYPNKKLILPFFNIVEPMKTPAWSKNLYVEKLVINPSATAFGSSILSLCSIPCGVSELTFTDLSQPEILYRMLKNFGPSLKCLTLREAVSFNTRHENTLNLYKVMSLCPVLERFSTSSFLPLEADGSKHNIAPQHFVNMKSFELEGECKWFYAPQLGPFFDIYKMVLLGSKCYKVLEIQNAHVLKVTAKFLEANPNCLTEVEVFNAVAREAYGNVWDNISLICQLLLKRSPHLKRIEINGPEDAGFLPLWFLNTAARLGVQIRASNQFTCGGIPSNNFVHVFSTTVRPPDTAIWHGRFFPHFKLGMKMMQEKMQELGLFGNLDSEGEDDEAMREYFML